jgi:hypothetical protein
MAMTAAERKRASRERQRAAAASALEQGGTAAEGAQQAAEATKAAATAQKASRRGALKVGGTAAAGEAITSAGAQPERVQVTGRTRRETRSGDASWSEEEPRMVPASMVAGEVKANTGSDVSLGVPSGDSVETTHLTRGTRTAAAPPKDSPTAGFVEVSTLAPDKLAARADKGLATGTTTSARGAGWYTKPQAARRAGAKAVGRAEDAMTEAAGKLASVPLPGALHLLATQVHSGEMTADQARDAHESLKKNHPDYADEVVTSSKEFADAHEALHASYGRFRQIQDRVQRSGQTLPAKRLGSGPKGDQDLGKVDDLSGASVSSPPDKVHITPTDLERAGNAGPLDVVPGEALGQAHRDLRTVHAYAHGITDPTNGARGVVRALRHAGHDISLDPSALPTATSREDAVDVHQQRMDAAQDQAVDRIMSHPMNQDLSADVAGTAQHGEANFLVAHAKKHGVDVGGGTAKEIKSGAVSRQRGMVDEAIRTGVVGVTQKAAENTPETPPTITSLGGLPAALGHVKLADEALEASQSAPRSTTGKTGFGASDAEHQHFEDTAVATQSRLLQGHAQSEAGQSLVGGSGMDEFERAFHGAKAAVGRKISADTPAVAAAVPTPTASTPRPAPPTTAPAVTWARSPSPMETGTDVQSIRAREQLNRESEARAAGPLPAPTGASKVEKPAWLQQREAGQTPDIERGVGAAIARRQAGESTSRRSAEYRVANARAGGANVPALPSESSPAPAGGGNVGMAPRAPEALQRVTPGRTTSESRRRPGLSASHVTEGALAITPATTPRPTPVVGSAPVTDVRRSGGKTQLKGYGEGRVKKSGKQGR